MSTVNDDEIERLASRMAMLVSDDGEADNAGRAVGALARRLGLSGGQLKAIFMAGAESAGTAHAAAQASRISMLEAEIDRLHEALRRAETTSRSLLRERDALHGEAEQLQQALDSRRTARQVKLAMGLVAVLAVAGGLWVNRNGLPLHVFGDGPDLQDGTPQYHTAVIRDQPVALHSDPDEASKVLSTLPVGTHLAVHRVLWHNLQQWVEVEIGGQTGFVMSTDVDLS